MPQNVLVIVDETTGDVLRVVVPDSDEQLDEVIFHGAGEEIAKVDLQVFKDTPDLAELKDAAGTEIARRRRLL
jgi:hypothetical protein